MALEEASLASVVGTGCNVVKFKRREVLSRFLTHISLLRIARFCRSSKWFGQSKIFVGSVKYEFTFSLGDDDIEVTFWFEKTFIDD